MTTETKQTTHSPTPWYHANGNEIHDKKAKYGEGGARIGDTPNRIAIVGYPYNDDAGKEAQTAFIVRAVNSHAALVLSLQECADEIDALTYDGSGARPTAISAVVHRARKALALALAEPTA